MTRHGARAISLALTIAMLATACTSGDDAKQADGGAKAEKVDYAKVGLWDDGPCDEAKPPLTVGLMTVFQSPTLSLEDQPKALEAAATAFNARGGANGSCIKVVTCDDGANLDKSVACAHKVDDAGVVATINDTGLAGNAEVAKAMSDAGIPRIASNVTQADWADPNIFPLDPGSTGYAFLEPQALIDAGAKKIAIVRVDQAVASALKGILEGIYGDQGVTFVADIPVPGGTTDFSQFILKAQNAGADSILTAIGGQELIQVIRAGEQLDTKLLIGAPPLSYQGMSDLGDFATKLIMTAGYTPPTDDVPVYAALRADMAASGDDVIQPENLTINAMRSWIGLYALLRMIRDAKMTEFTRDGITAMLKAAKDVPMLDIYGGQDWTPDFTREGTWQRAGIDRGVSVGWDPDLETSGYKGSFVKKSEVSFDEVTCGSPIGAPEPC